MMRTSPGCETSGRICNANPLNFPGHGEGDGLVRNAFGPATYARLQTIKRKYDPRNLFRMNQNILPE
jgi:hypothetical protein